MELFDYSFLVIALWGAILSALSTSLLSVFISLKKISYMGEALSHISFAGLALALLVNLPVVPVALVVVVGVALFIGYLSRRYNLDESNITTIFLSLSMAVAIILLSIKQNYAGDLAGYLFGDILLITQGDLISLSILLVFNLLFITLFFKELFYITYNQAISSIFKIPARLVYYLFLVFIAINIVMTVKVVGIVLITAQLILPGIIALNLTKRIKRAILFSAAASVIASVSGFFISYLLDCPSGATIVVVLFILFLLSLVVKTLRQRAESA